MSRQSRTVPKTPRRRDARRHLNPFALYGVLFTVLGVSLFGFLAWRTLLASFTLDWLVAVNVTAIIAFFYDKKISGRRLTRVPEHVLLGIALLGGSPGAILAMRLARHKTNKRSFLMSLAMIVVAQFALLGVYLVALQ